MSVSVSSISSFVPATGGTNPSSGRDVAVSGVINCNGDTKPSRVQIEVVFFTDASYALGDRPVTGGGTQTYPSDTIFVSHANQWIGTNTGEALVFPHKRYRADDDLYVAQPMVTTAPIPNGVYHSFLRLVDNWSSSGTVVYDWVNLGSFTVSYTIPVPTAVTPVDGSTINTDLPILSCAVTKGTETDAPKVRAEFQLATNSAFTTDVIQLFEEANKFHPLINPITYLLHLYGDAHTGYLELTGANPLHSGTWYIRARTEAAYGVGDSSWSAYNTFTVSHPASGFSLSPSAGQMVAYASTIEFDWAVSDTSPIDGQSAYEIIVAEIGTGTVVLDTGVVTAASTLVDTTLRGTAMGAISSAEKDIPLQWKVQLTNHDGVVGPWSDWATFQVGDAPVVTISDPTSGETISNPSPDVDWSVVAGGTRTQARYRVTYALQATPDALLYDTGWVADPAATSLAPSVMVFANGDLGQVTVYVQDTSGLVGSASDSFTISYTLPAAITSMADGSLLDDLGYVSVTWAITDPDSDFYSFRIYRAPLGATAFTLIGELPIAQARDFQDWSAAANSSYQYVVLQVATRFGVTIESLGLPVGTSTGGQSYWLICPSVPSLSVKLPSVKDDAPKDEWDTAVTNLYGRGRRVEYGTHWGYTGTLTAQYRDAPSEGGLSLGFAALTALKNLCVPLQLRTPFGQIWDVSTDDLNVTRVPGTGAREAVDVAITYYEITSS